MSGYEGTVGDYEPVELGEYEALPGPRLRNVEVSVKHRQRMIVVLLTIIPDARFLTSDGHMHAEPFINVVRDGRYFYARCGSTRLRHVLHAALRLRWLLRKELR